MARSLVLGNGNSLVCLDNYGQVRDFYFPYVGHENHVGQNQVHRIGVFVDGEISWVDNGDWYTEIKYQKNTMVGNVTLRNDKIKISIESIDVVYNEKNIFLRKIKVSNDSNKKREINIFLNQQFKIGDTNHADTAYFSSTIESIIHYKGRRVFLVGGTCENKPFDDYGIGFCGIEGKEGTWRDAEDGLLSKNPIEHGIVDSVISWKREMPENSSITIYYWVAVGETYREVCELLDYVLNKSGEHLIDSTQDFWQAWVNQVSIPFYGLSEESKKLFYDSLFVMRTHADNRGGILASADSGNVQYGGDTYSYVWPRDACYTAWTFDLIGFYDISRRFYEFADEVLTEEGYILHKYQPDYSLGSSWHPWVKDGRRQLAIQEDETAILLVGLWEHYSRAKDLEFVESLYNRFIKRSAEFIIRYKDANTGLPLPSYDLWEEKYGVSSYPASVAFGALISAGHFAKTLGKEEDMANFYKEAESLRRSIINYLWDDNEKRFINLVGEKLEKDPNLDASCFYGVFRYGVLSPEDSKMKEAFEVLNNRLKKGNIIGGVPRYENDAYANVGGEAVGNPWFVTTLWLTQYKIACANSVNDLEKVFSDIEWVTKNSKNSVLSEQINPYTGSPISAMPLVWSHSEFVRTIVECSKKSEALKTSIKIIHE
jgi:glucoamylase